MRIVGLFAVSVCQMEYPQITLPFSSFQIDKLVFAAISRRIFSRKFRFWRSCAFRRSAKTDDVAVATSPAKLEMGDRCESFLNSWRIGNSRTQTSEYISCVLKEVED